MTRVQPAPDSGEVADRMRARRGGSLTPLDEALLHSEPLADGWNNLLGAVRSELALPGEIRELAICRVAELNGAEYEWRAHAPIALREGMTGEQLAALREGGDPSALTEIQALVMQYTDAMTRTVTVADALSDRLHSVLGTRQFVELTGTIAAYNMVSRFLVALHVGQIRTAGESEATA